MMLALVQEPLPTPDAFQGWVFGHADDHLEIITAIRKIVGLQLTYYPINVYSKGSSEIWKEWHQQMHNDMASVLGISVSDLQDVDFEKPELVSSWYFSNMSDHRAAHQVLGR